MLLVLPEQQIFRSGGPSKKVENRDFDQVEVQHNDFAALTDHSNGSRTPEKEEEIFHSEGSDEAEVEEGQSVGQSYHRSELVDLTPPASASQPIIS